MEQSILTSTIISSHDIPLLKEDVHLFCFNIDHFDRINLQNLTTPEELTKAAAFRQTIDAQRFLAGRIISKRMLAQYTNVSIGDFTIQNGFNNKPFASIKDSHQTLPQFNISHSGKIVLVAFSDSDVGVDTEVMKHIDFLQIAEAVFSNAELQLLTKSTVALETFYRLWTQKEALLKALGLGLIDDTRIIDLSDGIDNRFVLKHTDTAFELLNFIPFENHQATVCFEKGKRVKFFSLTDALFS